MSDDDNDFYVDEPSQRLSKDLRAAAATLGDHEVRFMVQAYLSWQEERKRNASRARTLDEANEPHDIIRWLARHSTNLENQIKVALDIYTSNHLMGSYMREKVHGVGPVLAAGLLSHIYMGRWCGYRSPEGNYCHAHNAEDCLKFQADKKRKLPSHNFNDHIEISLPTVGRIYSFAGWAADNQKPWERKKKRPFNAQFKTLCWKVGTSFVYQSNHPKCFYGHVYRDRKAYEIDRNSKGLYADQARKKLETTNIDKNTDAYRHYSSGRLPPGHIDSRARRYAVKLFLAHMHEEWYERMFGDKPPKGQYPIRPPVTP